MSDVYENMKVNGIILPGIAKPSGIYLTVANFSDKLFYTSGKGWTQEGRPACTGKIGKDLSVEEGQEAARMSMLNLLGNIEAEIKDLNKIKKIIKVLGFISSGDDFFEQTKVLNGASQVLVDIFGEDVGKGARTAIGVNSLPFNMPVEIEMIFEIV
tara:strand:- start:516 stop:983 length:468 start_codon:yes stop_codon:yes gene_type:complete